VADGKARRTNRYCRANAIVAGLGAREPDFEGLALPNAIKSDNLSHNAAVIGRMSV